MSHTTLSNNSESLSLQSDSEPPTWELYELLYRRFAVAVATISLSAALLCALYGFTAVRTTDGEVFNKCIWICSKASSMQNTGAIDAAGDAQTRNPPVAQAR